MKRVLCHRLVLQTKQVWHLRQLPHQTGHSQQATMQHSNNKNIRISHVINKAHTEPGEVSNQRATTTNSKQKSTRPCYKEIKEMQPLRCKRSHHPQMPGKVEAPRISNLECLCNTKWKRYICCFYIWYFMMYILWFSSYPCIWVQKYPQDNTEVIHAYEYKLSIT